MKHSKRKVIVCGIEKDLELIDWVYPDYVEKYNIKEAEYDEYHEYLLIQSLVKNGYVVAGDTHQNCILPLFNDGYVELSMRKWGEIMAVAMNIRENTKKYDYMDFYMACTCKVSECLPEKIQKRVDEDF